MEEIRKILSPVQVAKFFVFVETHQHSVRTLTNMWDRDHNETLEVRGMEEREGRRSPPPDESYEGEEEGDEGDEEGEDAARSDAPAAAASSRHPCTQPDEAQRSPTKPEDRGPCFHRPSTFNR